MDPRPLIYYISAHGYGHGVRSTDILDAFHRLRPEVPVVVVTGLDPRFLANRLPGWSPAFRQAAFDVGMVQLDSVRVDLPATLRRVQALHAKRATLLKAERDYLSAAGAALVVTDIPALPLEAAAGLGLPRLAVGNFAWDWIYEPFAEKEPAWDPLVRWFREGYAHAQLLLRLPFSEPMRAFAHQEKIGLVARPGTPRRAELARLTGADPGKPWVLLSFTSLEWPEEALARVRKLEGYEFFTVCPLAWAGHNLHAVDREQVGFCDVLASCEAVVSKPGFGLLSDCVVNGKPLLYVERTDFIEYPILVDATKRYLKNLHLPAAELYRGNLGPWLEQLDRQPGPPEQVACDGAGVAASRMAAFYEQGAGA